MENLQEKWRDYFDLLDVNNDSVLDSVDVNLSKVNYVRLHNLTEQEVCGYINMIHCQDSKLHVFGTLMIWEKDSHSFCFNHLFIYVYCDGDVHQQIVGITMETNYFHL